MDRREVDGKGKRDAEDRIQIPKTRLGKGLEKVGSKGKYAKTQSLNNKRYKKNSSQG